MPIRNIKVKLGKNQETLKKQRQVLSQVEKTTLTRKFLIKQEKIEKICLKCIKTLNILLLVPQLRSVDCYCYWKIREFKKLVKIVKNHVRLIFEKC